MIWSSLNGGMTGQLLGALVSGACVDVEQPAATFASQLAPCLGEAGPRARRTGRPSQACHACNPTHHVHARPLVPQRAHRTQYHGSPALVVPLLNFFLAKRPRDCSIWPESYSFALVHGHGQHGGPQCCCLMDRAIISCALQCDRSCSHLGSQHEDSRNFIDTSLRNSRTSRSLCTGRAANHFVLDNLQLASMVVHTLFHESHFHYEFHHLVSRLDRFSLCYYRLTVSECWFSSSLYQQSAIS